MSSRYKVRLLRPTCPSSITLLTERKHTNPEKSDPDNNNRLISRESPVSGVLQSDPFAVFPVFFESIQAVATNNFARIPPVDNHRFAQQSPRGRFVGEPDQIPVKIHLTVMLRAIAATKTIESTPARSPTARVVILSPKDFTSLLEQLRRTRIQGTDIVMKWSSVRCHGVSSSVKNEPANGQCQCNLEFAVILSGFWEFGLLTGADFC